MSFSKEYCECGCKGYEIRVAGFYGWMWWNTKIGKDSLWIVNTQHNNYGSETRFEGKGSRKAANDLVESELKRHIKKAKKEIEDAEKRLSTE